MTPWRLLRDGRCPARRTMEKDLDLFEAVRSGFLPGALRIYNWAEPAVTIGYHQKSFTLSDPSLEIPILRRPTGGGAVLHVDDITFSISSPSTGHLSGSIPECSGRISNIFAMVFHRCGIDVEARGGEHGFSDVCFARPSPVELMFCRSKLMGLALTRKERHLLVQGVIPLKVDQSLSQRVFGMRLPHPLVGILDYLPDFSVDAFACQLRVGFASELGVLLQESDEEYHESNGADECKVEPR
jgi:lipoate-protein ligase A